jgi:hypothetical protein
MEVSLQQYVTRDIWTKELLHGDSDGISVCIFLNSGDGEYFIWENIKLQWLKCRGFYVDVPMNVERRRCAEGIGTWFLWMFFRFFRMTENRCNFPRLPMFQFMPYNSINIIENQEYKQLYYIYFNII